ncbi:hypothetical protein [Marinifilum sp.]|uniref:hypothetical protein n=1 Tax=Marinifilum sp. TaxID=2033137 RepID=UPI003BAA9029
MDTLLCDFGNYSLWLVSEENLVKISNFIVKVNQEFHLKTNTINYYELIKTITLDLESYSSSHFYAIKNRNHEIIGSIKAQKWDGITKLPIEEDFKIDLKEVLQSLPFTPSEVWHIGRFAIDQKKIISDPYLRKFRITYLKMLLANSFQHISKKPDNIAIAECDKKLFEKLKLMGIQSAALKESKYYLGSETLPILNTGMGVNQFVNDNKNLCFDLHHMDLHSA